MDQEQTGMMAEQATEPQGMGLLQRIIGVLISPGKTFEDIGRKPTWLGMMVVIIACNVAVTAAIFSVVDIEKMMRHQMEVQNVSISGDQMEDAIELQMKIVPVTAVAGAFIGPPLVLLILTAIFYVPIKAMGGEQTYGQMFSVSAFSFTVPLIQGLLSVPVVLAAEEPHTLDLQNVVKANLTLFLSDEVSRPLYAFAASIDAFSFWWLALVAVGYGIVSKKPVASAITVACLWLLWVIVKVGFTAIFSAMQG